MSSWKTFESLESFVSDAIEKNLGKFVGLDFTDGNSSYGIAVASQGRDAR
jgi:hypothetical protein